MPHRRPYPAEPAHDVLAAEEFGMPAPDPALHSEPAHDVLAAEEFGMPSVDPRLHFRGPVALPGDPTGIVEPHDVLAAEEFAMPAGRLDARVPVVGRGEGSRRRLVPLGVAALLVLHRRRRRHA